MSTHDIVAPGASAVATARTMLKRTIMLLPRTPATYIPSIAFPLLITVAVSGSLSGVAKLPNYPYVRQIDFIMPFALVQSGMIAGMGTGFSLIRDLETRFFDRFLTAPVSRRSIIVGFMAGAFFRAMIPFVAVVAVGTLDGARFAHLSGIVWLFIANQGMAICGGAWGVGMALRFKTMRAAPLMFLPIFLAVFLSTSQVPYQYITGWLRPIARWNPVTQVLDLARSGFVRQFVWGDVWPGLVVIAAMTTALSWFAMRGLRRVEI